MQPLFSKSLFSKCFDYIYIICYSNDFLIMQYIYRINSLMIGINSSFRQKIKNPNIQIFERKKTDTAKSVC